MTAQLTGEDKRQDVQKEGIHLALKTQRIGLGISMGVGKTLIGLKYLEYLFRAGLLSRVLIVAPKIKIFQVWKDDAIKFNIDPEVMAAVTFSTYISFPKNDGVYSVIILDECHSLTYSHQVVLSRHRGRILGLTGTPPRHRKSEKGVMVSMFCPIKFTYLIDEAVQDAVTNDYRIIVHMMSLSEETNVHVQTKNADFYTSEVRNYEYWSGRVREEEEKADEGTGSAKDKMIVTIMRMKALMGFQTKVDYAKKLIEEIDDKLIVFCNTQDQADELCQYSVHSDNDKSDANLQLFKDDIIDKLSCVLQISEGVNIPNLRAGIMLHSYTNERKTKQRLGRLLRLNPNDLAVVHILCYKDTVDETWVMRALKDFDPDKIHVFDSETQQTTPLNEPVL